MMFVAVFNFDIYQVSGIGKELTGSHSSAEIPAGSSEIQEGMALWRGQDLAQFWMGPAQLCSSLLEVAVLGSLCCVIL